MTKVSLVGSIEAVKRSGRLLSTLQVSRVGASLSSGSANFVTRKMVIGSFPRSDVAWIPTMRGGVLTGPTIWIANEVWFEFPSRSVTVMVAVSCVPALA